MDWLILIAGAFLAGLVDAVVGGGGLIQTPLLLAVFPQVPIPILFGTNKISSVCGTASAAWQYGRKVQISRDIAYPAATSALVGSALGAAVVSFLPVQALKPMVVVLLVLVGLYTYFKPNFGQQASHSVEARFIKPLAVLVGLGIGFYDGFFGPGTGSFLIFAFVRLFGMDMLRASAMAKIVNLATNVAAIGYFLSHQGVMWGVGLTMALANVAGAQTGTHMALKHGNGFVRGLLLVVVSILAVKLGWDVYKTWQ